MASRKEDSWESAHLFLQELSRVNKVEVKFGHEIKTWYLNLTQDMSSTLKDIGKKELFKEAVRLTEP